MGYIKIFCFSSSESYFGFAIFPLIFSGFFSSEILSSKVSLSKLISLIFLALTFFLLPNPTTFESLNNTLKFMAGFNFGRFSVILGFCISFFPLQKLGFPLLFQFPFLANLKFLAVILELQLSPFKEGFACNPEYKRICNQFLRFSRLDRFYGKSSRPCHFHRFP